MIWLARIIIYGAAGYVALFIIYPNVNYLFSFLVGGLLAALAIAFETFVSAKSAGHSLEDEAKQRFIKIDKMMSSEPVPPNRHLEPGERQQAYLPPADEVEAEIIDEQEAEVIEDWRKQ